ncbi:hypothetical protein [Methylobacterium sp. ID0610]|uniref:hypothetical protein n=1 Tax=Methylobacterium carpenticola TaxID=3344827 RepID=UPI00368881A8
MKAQQEADMAAIPRRIAALNREISKLKRIEAVARPSYDVVGLTQKIKINKAVS